MEPIEAFRRFVLCEGCSKRDNVIRIDRVLLRTLKSQLPFNVDRAPRWRFEASRTVGLPMDEASHPNTAHPQWHASHLMIFLKSPHYAHCRQVMPLLKALTIRD